jgi:hypothetical protein
MLYLAFGTHLAFSRFEGEPAATHPRCDRAALSTCQVNHHNGEGVCRGYVAALDEKLAPVDRDLERLRQQRDDLLSALRATDAKLDFSRREQNFLVLTEANQRKKPPALPTGLSLESVFQLDHLSTAWGRKFAGARKQKLISQDSALTISRQKILASQSENESKISGLTGLKNELTAQKNHWLGDIGIHVHMWQRGCENQICPGN